MDGSGPRQEDELTARAAWLHFVGGLRQSDVARRLDISVARAHRYIAKAQSEGLVRVSVDMESAECAVLENELIRAFGLSYCRVAMDATEVGPLPLRALSVVGAAFIQQAVAARSHDVIGVGNGRTLSACVDAMGRSRADHLHFVSMLGGLTRSFAANPYDVIHKLAQKTGAESYLMPAPLFANSAEDKRIMMDQGGLAATMELIDRATLLILGVGDADPAGGSASSQALREDGVMTKLRAEGAEAELLGQFLRADGAGISTALDARVMAPALSDLKGREIVAIAGGLQKAAAIHAALNSGLLTGLIIDEATARHLVGKISAASSEAAE
ncbi:MAG: sugar-binding transcriptional regulator [Pseudomonadota bacterium]